MNLIVIVACILFFNPISAVAGLKSSSINLSVETSASDLSTIINNSVPNELYKGQSSFGSSLTVLRTGSVAVSAADNFIYITVPVQLTLRYGLYESYPLRAGLRFKTKVHVTPDWRLKTELYYTGLSDKLLETLKLGPFTLSPKSLVESITQPVQRMLTPIIDNRINDAVQLRAKVDPLWQNAFTPILLNSEFSTWLKMAPERIVMSPLLAANNQIRLSVGVITGAELTIGPKPAAAAVRPLPQLQQLAAFDKSFHIQLGADVFFNDLVKALNPVLLEKTFGEERKITVKKFNLQGSDGRLILNMETVGDFDGELTLHAKPVYNGQKNTLTFEDIDFDTKNAGWLISAGSWLFKSTIRDVIKEKLDGAVSEQMEKARLQASSALSSIQIAERVKLTGIVNSLSLGNAVVRQDRLSVQVIAQGEAAVMLK